jgi:hypothetical protein
MRFEQPPGASDSGQEIAAALDSGLPDGTEAGPNTWDSVHEGEGRKIVSKISFVERTATHDAFFRGRRD